MAEVISFGAQHQQRCCFTVTGRTGEWGGGRRNEECRACLMDCVHLSAVCAERNPMAHSLRFLPYCRTQREYMNMGLLLLAGGLARRDSRARAGRCFYTGMDNWLTVPGPCLHGLPWPGLAWPVWCRSFGSFRDRLLSAVRAIFGSTHHQSQSPCKIMYDFQE